MAVAKVYSDSVTKLNGSKAALYSFGTQPCYDAPLKTGVLPPSSDGDITANDPLLKGVVFDTQFVCSLDNEELLYPERFEFCMEPPKGLVFPNPLVFTLMGPLYFGLSQPAAFNEFVSGEVDPYAYTTTIISIVREQMQVYYIPTDPIKTEEETKVAGPVRELDFYFRGIGTPTITPLVETGDRGGAFTAVSGQKYKFSTKAKFGTFRLRIEDEFAHLVDPTKTTQYKRSDNSVVIKLWPRTLPVQYQCNTDGALQHVGMWQMSYTPYPKINYNMAFYDMDDNLLDLDFPIDPKPSQLKIKKIDGSVTGDNELEDKLINVFFWRVSYNSAPYIPKTIKVGSRTSISIDGDISYPLRWYILPTNTPKGEKPVVIQKDEKNQNWLVAVSAGRFKLIVTDGSYLSYISSEITVN